MHRTGVGIFTGRFLPLHMGHVEAITKASCRVDKLYVALIHDEHHDKEICERKHFKYILPEIRVRWIRQLMKDIKNVKVITVNTSSMEEAGEKLLEMIPETITHSFKIDFEEDSVPHNAFEAMTEYTFGHDVLTYHVTEEKIRNEGVYSNWLNLSDIVRPYFVKKVVVIGTESSGKTTLANYLAKIFDTICVEEYGRLICEEMGGYEDLFTRDLFSQIAYGQKMLEAEGIKKANKVMFVDTEAIVTQYYSVLFDGEKDDVVEAVSMTQDYDLWIYLEPDIKWVEDDIRSYGDEKNRRENNVLLKSMLDERGINYISISGTYIERLNKAIELVNNLLTS